MLLFFKPVDIELTFNMIWINETEKSQKITIIRRPSEFASFSPLHLTKTWGFKINKGTFERSFEGEIPNKDEPTFFPTKVYTLFAKIKVYI